MRLAFIAVLPYLACLFLCYYDYTGPFYALLFTETLVHLYTANKALANQLAMLPNGMPDARHRVSVPEHFQYSQP